jgi:hypothetical protein
MFKPMQSSWFTGFFKFLSWGNDQAELLKPSKTIARNYGRELLKVKPIGQIIVTFNVSLMNLKNLGYN